ncbi:MAG: T9SS type A sorting domain-containing protein [Flavipsychrobacter sp.]|nr:T9SS type A sorting domain-containing protein [Flavipsychrobacter sp.]
MKHFILATLITLILPLTVKGQIQYYDTVFYNFTVDTLPKNIVLDTSTQKLWQLGSTLKVGFSNGVLSSFGLMTDTTKVYPPSANSSFMITGFDVNPIVDIWHEYQTHNGHAGGIIEFSVDTGHTWYNISYCGAIYGGGTYDDTLLTGEHAFTGNSYGQQNIRIQFITCMAEKTTSICNLLLNQPSSYVNFMLRFRFVSDSLVDSLSGWKIDSIRVIGTGCYGAVATVEPNVLKVVPNPAYNGVFYFPELMNSEQCTINIYDSRGVSVLKAPYKHELDLGNLPAGFYFYKVTGSNVPYSGKLLYE